MRENGCIIQWAFSVFIGMLLLPLLNACSFNTSPHQTYNYGNFSCPSNTTVHPSDEFATLSLHSGAQINLKWEPFSGQLSTETTPSPVILSATLLGPFSSLNDAQQVSHRDTISVLTPIVVSMPPIQTDDWTNKTYTSIMKLPPGLLPGYYVEIERAEDTNHNRGAGLCILKITP